MAYTEAPHQLGLGFTCKPNKSVPFIGREAYLQRRDSGQGPFLCSIKLHDPKPILHHNEPVLRDGVVVGFITSGAFAYAQGASVGLCFVSPASGGGRASLASGSYEVMVEGKEYSAEVSLKPFSGSV